MLRAAAVAVVWTICDSPACRRGTEAGGRFAGLRDTLLPKLLSGEVEVPEQETLLADCV
jgi:hypothetical protein